MIFYNLHKYVQTTVTRKDHDGHDHIYTGVILAEILKKAGATLGADLKGKNLAKCILITASDNYQVVLRLLSSTKLLLTEPLYLPIRLMANLCHQGKARSALLFRTRNNLQNASGK